MEKKRQQTYNVIFIQDKRLNSKPNSKPNPKFFSYFVLTLNNFDYSKFQFNNKDHIHGLTVKLWSNNEQDINIFGIL